MLTEYYHSNSGLETVFTADPRPIKFGPGAALEIGSDARQLGMQRIALFTDSNVLQLERTQQALQALRNAHLEVMIYAKTLVEPTDGSFKNAGKFLSEGDFDGVVSIGGGSVIDTAKAANLYTCHPAPLLAYVNKPIGEGIPVPGPLLPHIALPTTAGTGSESTGVAVFDLLSQSVKTGIASKFMKPDFAVIDPDFTYSLPPLVTAATAFDVLTHAIESYTAIPFSKRLVVAEPSMRSAYQGANPHSDIGSLQSIHLGGQYLLRAVNDGMDREARIAMAWAATLAGIAFGNAGVHIPHAMSYSVAGLIGDYHPAGWPAEHALCPHGISVVVNAPAAFRFTAPTSMERHLQAAEALGADISGAHSQDAGPILADTIRNLMRAAGVPNGLSELGYTSADIPQLVDGAYAQQRLLSQSPKPVGKEDLQQLYRNAMKYW